MKYSVERTKIITVKNRHDATTFKLMIRAVVWQTSKC